MAYAMYYLADLGFLLAYPSSPVQLNSLIQEHGVHAYFNGHDHTQTHASPHVSTGEQS